MPQASDGVGGYPTLAQRLRMAAGRTFDAVESPHVRALLRRAADEVERLEAALTEIRDLRPCSAPRCEVVGGHNHEAYIARKVLGNPQAGHDPRPVDNRIEPITEEEDGVATEVAPLDPDGRDKNGHCFYCGARHGFTHEPDCTRPK